MSETLEHREVIEKIAGPEVEVTDELLAELSELSKTASAEARGGHPKENSQIIAAREEYFRRLGWTHPESPYYSGYNQRVSKSRAPRPDRLIESFSKLAEQGIDLARITDKEMIALAGGNKDRLNQAYTYIKRMGEFAVRTVIANGIEVEDFNTTDLVNRKPYLLLLSREKLGKLARSLFGLEYTSLSTDAVADKVRRNRPGHIANTSWGGNELNALPHQLRQKIERFSNPTDKDDIARWYTLGANKINHSNSRQVKEARAQFVDVFLLENTDEKLVEAGKALVRYAQQLGQPLPKTSHIVEVMALLEDIDPEKGREIIKNRPELFYIPPARIKEKIDILKNNINDLLEVLSNSPHLVSLSLPSFIEKFNSRQKSQRAMTKSSPVVLPDADSDRSEVAVSKPIDTTPVINRQPRKPRIPKVAQVDIDTIDKAVLGQLRQLHAWSGTDSFEDFVNICSGLSTMRPEGLEQLVEKVKNLYESDEDCSLRVIARLARELK